MRFRGVVVAGKGRGAELGFPTANLKINLKLEPGIYPALVELDGEQKQSALFYNVDGFGEARCEVYIIGFDGNLYGRTIDVEVTGSKVSEVARGLSDENLSKKIFNDIERVKYVLGNNKR